MPVTVRGTDILFNNGTTQSTAAVVDTTAVLNATAAASVGAVGTYAFLSGNTVNVSAWNPGATVAGSQLMYVGSQSPGQSGGTPAGTWRVMGRGFFSGPDGYGGTFFAASPTLFLRIS